MTHVCMYICMCVYRDPLGGGGLMGLPAAPCERCEEGAEKYLMTLFYKEKKYNRKDIDKHKNLLFLQLTH